MDCFSGSKHAYSPVTDCFSSWFSGLSVIWQTVAVGSGHKHTHTPPTRQKYTLSLHLSWHMQRKLPSCLLFLLMSLHVTAYLKNLLENAIVIFMYIYLYFLFWQKLCGSFFRKCANFLWKRLQERLWTTFWAETIWQSLTSTASSLSA